MSLPARVVAEAATQARPRRGWVHEAALVAILLMETSWLVPWFRSLTPALRTHSTWMTSAAFLGLALIAMVTARAARALALRPPVRRALLLAGLLVSISAALRLFLFWGAAVGTIGLLAQSVGTFSGVLELLPNELIVILAVLFVWRRGVVAAGRDPCEPASAAHEFRLGILAFAAHSLVYRLEQAALMLEVLPVYFLAALAAVGLSRADRLASSRGSARPPFTLQWIAALVLLSGLTVALGLWAGAALRAPSVASALEKAAAFLVKGADVLLVILAPFVIVLAEAGRALSDLLHRLLGTSLRFPEFPELPEAPMLPPVEPGVTPAWLQAYGPLLRIAGTLVVLVLLALAAIRTGRRRSGSAAEGLEEQVDALEGRLGIGDAVRGFVGTLLGRGRRVLRRRLLAARAVRRLYARLLHLAEAHGVQRDPAKTPLEFQADLLGLFADRPTEVKALTQAYVRVRYGELPESQEEVSYLKACLESIARCKPMAEVGR